MAASKLKRPSTFIGAGLIALGICLLWWTLFVSSPHAVPVMLGILVLILGFLIYQGVWDRSGSQRRTAQSAKQKRGGQRRKKHKK